MVDDFSLSQNCWKDCSYKFAIVHWVLTVHRNAEWSCNFFLLPVPYQLIIKIDSDEEDVSRDFWHANFSIID
jgi:hypothetical protein